MIFVVDNNVFSRSLTNVPLDVFDDIYLPWSLGMREGFIISVDEVFNELKNVWEQPKEKRTKGWAWLCEHKFAFQDMTTEESGIVAEIFKSAKFREGVKERSLREGTPEADAILVAKAKCVNGIIVTAESNTKLTAEKIPNICVSLGVPYITIDHFYRVLRNMHNSREPLEDVKVWTMLDVEESADADFGCLS